MSAIRGPTMRGLIVNSRRYRYYYAVADSTLTLLDYGPVPTPEAAVAKGKLVADMYKEDKVGKPPYYIFLIEVEEVTSEYKESAGLISGQKSEVESIEEFLKKYKVEVKR